MSVSAPGNAPPDPLTGRPVLPPDLEQLALMTKGDTRYAFRSIPGTLYYITQVKYPDRHLCRRFVNIPSFRLDTSGSRNATYTRLYTQWLFSGCAPPDVAIVHADGTVAFDDRMRAAIYWVRRAVHEGVPSEEFEGIITKICCPTSTVAPLISAERWMRLLTTEPIAQVAHIWSHALPQHNLGGIPPQPAETTVMNRPFSAVSQTPQVPPGWFTWKPNIPADAQNWNRRYCHELQVQYHWRYEKYIDPLLVAPRGELSSGMEDRKQSAKGISKRFREAPVVVDLDFEAATTNEYTSRKRLRTQERAASPPVQQAPSSPGQEVPAQRIRRQRQHRRGQHLLPVEKDPMFACPTPTSPKTQRTALPEAQLDENIFPPNDARTLQRKFSTAVEQTNDGARAGLLHDLAVTMVDNNKRAKEKKGINTFGDGNVKMSIEAVLLGLWMKK